MSGFIHGTLPWADAERRPYESGNHGRYQLNEQDLLCFECPLPECDQSDSRCPFSYANSEKLQRRRRNRAKRTARLRSKWNREIDAAHRAVLAEREPECAT